MYNAMASSDTPGTRGTTCLHMDMADAVNVMLYAALTPDGKPGGAIWHIYNASDTGKIREFLRAKVKARHDGDPIHSQKIYLDCTLRAELYNRTRVKSYLVYQVPGDAVFIPAGCAHQASCFFLDPTTAVTWRYQVCNLADCIKVAIDFVSPENISRCETLTKEFREENRRSQWKEDVLQLRTMMWFAWLSCRIQGAVRDEKGKAACK